MVAYRVYFLDGTGRIQLADWIEARDDDDAVRQARKAARDASRCEIWDKDRLVARIDTHGATS